MDLQIINIIISCSINRLAWLIWVSRLSPVHFRPKFRNLSNRLGSGRRPQGKGCRQGMPARKAKATWMRRQALIRASRTNNWLCSRSSRNQKTTSMVLLPKSNRANARERTALLTDRWSKRMEARQTSYSAISVRRTTMRTTGGWTRPMASSTSWIPFPTIQRCRHSRKAPLREKSIRLRRKSEPRIWASGSAGFCRIGRVLSNVDSRSKTSWKSWKSKWSASEARIASSRKR